MAATQSFHLFSKLPVELRLKIYHFALTPRTVPVRLKLDLDSWNWSAGKDWWTCYAIVPDTERPSAPRPTVLGACFEAREELKGLYGGLEIDQEILETLLIPRLHTDAEDLDEDIDSESLTRKMVENLLSQRGKHRRPRFNSDRDTLEWREPRRWVCCGDEQLRMLVHPLFLAASLSVRRVSIEYVTSMADLLEVMALAVLDTRRGSCLETFDISVKNPSDCRVLRFRLCRLPEVIRPAGKKEIVGRVMDAVEDRPQEIEELVRRHGLVWFPWARSEAYCNGNSSQGDACETRFRRIIEKIACHTALASRNTPAVPTDSSLYPFLPSENLATKNVAILQVLAETDPTTGPGASGT